MTASHNPPSIIDSFCRFEQSKPNELFLSEPVKQVYQNFTWQSAGEEIRKMVTAIHSMGIHKGDKIAILSKNCAYWVMADLAIMMAGCVSIPLYPNISPTQLNEILLHSDSKMIFLGKLDEPEKMKAAVPKQLVQVCFPFYLIENCPSWIDITREQKPFIGNPIIDVDSLACIIYTSGTTGKPKGVMHTFRAMNFAVASFLKANPTIQTEIFFSYLPLCHVAEKMLVECGTLFTGSTMYFVESMDRFSKNLQDTKPTIFLAVPRIWEKMQEEILNKMPQKKLDRILSIPIVSGIFKKIIRKKLGLTRAHFIFTGASPINKALLYWYSKLGIIILEAYGMTENLALSHANRKNAIKFGTVGKAYEEVIVRLAGDQEVQVKSPASMIGYYKEPELSSACFEDGFLKTGDQGSIDSEGFLTITGRIKDQFKTSKGKYINPAPIESQLLSNNLIGQACVVGHALPHALALCILSESSKNIDQSSITNNLSEFLKTVNADLEHHERIAKLVLISEEWTVENAILTPTLKIKRKMVDEKYQNQYQNWSTAAEFVIFSDLNI
jgi:long-chain acyl-CoA synthetase